MTRGRAATPEPFDLGAVAGSDELFEALSTRRPADLGTGRTDADDPAAALLAALVADVDAGAPALPPAPRVSCGMPNARRRGVRVVVTFGVAALMLTSAGAAAAGGGGGKGFGVMRTTHGPARVKGTERSNANTQRQAPALPVPLSVRRPVVPHPSGTRRDPADRPRLDASRLPDDGTRERPPKRSRSGPHAPTGTEPPTPAPTTPPPWGPAPSPTPDPGESTPAP